MYGVVPEGHQSPRATESIIGKKVFPSCALQFNTSFLVDAQVSFPAIAAGRKVAAAGCKVGAAEGKCIAPFV